MTAPPSTWGLIAATSLAISPSLTSRSLTTIRIGIWPLLSPGDFHSESKLEVTGAKPPQPLKKQGSAANNGLSNAVLRPAPTRLA